MKLFLTVALSLLALLPLRAESPYRENEFQVDLFGSTATRDFGTYQHGLGTGIAFFTHRTFGFGAEFVSLQQGNDWLQSLDEVNLNIIARQPIGDSPLAIYGLIGAGNSLQEHEWRLNTGAGVELRFGSFGVFGDGRWVNNFDTVGYAQFRAGVRLNF